MAEERRSTAERSPWLVILATCAKRNETMVEQAAAVEDGLKT